MSEVAVENVETALDLFFRAVGGEVFEDLDGFNMGEWASTHVRLPSGYHSEISSPFLDAYSEIQDEIYRLVALVKSGNADIRSLSQEEVEQFELRVKVEAGSSVFEDNIPQLLEKLATELVGKMDGSQTVIVIMGLGLLVAASYGARVFLESRKEIKIAELQTSERTRAIEALEFANRTEMEQAATIREAMKNSNEVAQRALAVAERTQDELVKAASRTNETEIGESHLTRQEARILTSSTRRRRNKRIVEQEMRVVDVNTADALHTTVIIEDPETSRQFKVTFRDAIIEEDEKENVFLALRQREPVWLRLSEKYSDDEVLGYEIISVIGARPSV